MNQDQESYSMYPATSSPRTGAVDGGMQAAGAASASPPSHHHNHQQQPQQQQQQPGMHFAGYQTPMPMYHYQQFPYMYAAAAAAAAAPGVYGFNMMGQNQMMYQSPTGTPNTSNGHTTKNNATHTSNRSNSTISSSNNRSNDSKKKWDSKYKFDISNLDSSSTPRNLTLELPLYFNTSEEEYRQAKLLRHNLRIPSASQLEQKDKVMDSIDEEEQKTTESSATEDTAPFQVTLPTVSAKPGPKSWSAIASNALNKNKQTSTANPNGPSHSPSPSTSPSSTKELLKNNSSTTPSRKEQNYIPPSTKGVESLGVISLRMCFDPDYIDYTLSNSSNTLPIKSIVPRGIANRANICFMSSVLQVLLYCQPFINILNIVSMRNMSSKLGTYKLLDACIEMYKQFDKDTCTKPTDSNESVVKKLDAIQPDTFYKTLSTLPKFKELKWGHQEDAEEFLTHLLDQLHEEFIAAIDSLTDNEIQNLLQSINDDNLKIFMIRNIQQYKKSEFVKSPSSTLDSLFQKYGTDSSSHINNAGNENGWHEVSNSSKKSKKPKTAAKRTVEIEPSPMSVLFGGQFRSVLDIPHEKESQSITLDPFQTIQLDISDPQVNDLESAFRKFSEYELLPFKSSSGSDVEAKKQTFIDKLPQVMLIQLKRFSFINNIERDNNMVNYNAYNGRIEKIRKKISFNHELYVPLESVSPVMINAMGLKDETNRKYELSGVIYHHGLSSDGGHYTADVYHRDDDKWYRIDDVNITELHRDDVLKSGDDGNDTRTAYILMYQKASV